MTSFIDLKKQLEPIRSEILEKVTNIIDSGNYIMGSEIENFEKEISSFLNVKHAISVANGSDALLLALMAIGVKAGDEVITTPFTFFATAGAIARLNAIPVFVDIDKKTFNIDVLKIEEKISNKTKAIIPVHLFGQSAEMDTINNIAKKHDLYVIEDAAQAIGSEYKNKKIGALGDISCFSFFPTKNLGCFGDGGLVTTNNDDLAEYIKKARLHGASKKYHHEFVGFNSRLDEIQAGILRIKLKHLNEWNNKRIELANEYSKNLKDFFEIPFIDKNCKHIFHQYALLAKNNLERNEIMEKLKKHNVATGIYYPIPLHLQDCFKSLGYKEGDFPVSENIAKKIFSLPLYPELSKTEIKKITDLIFTFFNKH